MITNLEVNKPKPIAVGETFKTYKHGTDVGPSIKALERGESILIQEFYNDGMSLLKDLHKYLKLKLPNKSF